MFLMGASQILSLLRPQSATDVGPENPVRVQEQDLPAYTPKKKSLVRKVAEVMGGGMTNVSATGVGLEPGQTEPSAVTERVRVPRILSLFPLTAPYVEAAAAQRLRPAQVRLQAELLKRGMQAEDLDRYIKTLPSYTKLGELGIVRIDPFAGIVEPVLKATELQDIGAVSTALSGALGKVQDPYIRGQVAGGISAALSAGNIDQALSLLNTGITRDAIARTPDRSVTEFETYLGGYLQQHGDSPSNRLDAVKQYRVLAGSGAGQASETAKLSLALRVQSVDERRRTSELATEFLSDARFSTAEAIKRLEQAVTLAKSMPAAQRNGLKVRNPRLSKRVEHLLAHYPEIKRAILGQLQTTGQFTAQQLEGVK